jgi:hypothetical protein
MSANNMNNIMPPPAPINPVRPENDVEFTNMDDFDDEDDHYLIRSFEESGAPRVEEDHRAAKMGH